MSQAVYELGNKIMKNLLAVIPLAATIGISVMAFSAKADSENPIFGNEFNASFVADLAVSETSETVDPYSTKPGTETEHQPDSSTSKREASHILRLPDIIVRPDPVDQEAAEDPEAKAGAREEMSSPLAALQVIDRGNRSQGQ